MQRRRRAVTSPVSCLLLSGQVAPPSGAQKWSLKRGPCSWGCPQRQGSVCVMNTSGTLVLKRVRGAEAVPRAWLRREQPAFRSETVCAGSCRSRVGLSWAESKARLCWQGQTTPSRSVCAAAMVPEQRPGLRLSLPLGRDLCVVVSPRNHPPSPTGPAGAAAGAPSVLLAAAPQSPPCPPPAPGARTRGERLWGTGRGFSPWGWSLRGREALAACGEEDVSLLHWALLRGVGAGCDTDRKCHRVAFSLCRGLGWGQALPWGPGVLQRVLHPCSQHPPAPAAFPQPRVTPCSAARLGLSPVPQPSPGRGSWQSSLRL